MPALRPRQERAMEKLNDWWSESLGVPVENERHFYKRSSDTHDPEAAQGQAQLVADVLNVAGECLLLSK